MRWSKVKATYGGLIFYAFLWDISDAFFTPSRLLERSPTTIHPHIFSNRGNLIHVPTALYRKHALGATLVDADALTNNLEERLKGVNVTSKVNVLSSDPLVYEVPLLLSEAECHAYQLYATSLEGSARTLTRSNPPEVSLDSSKLWPLPCLALFAGLPPYIRLLQQHKSFEDVNDPLKVWEIARAVVPDILVALSFMAAMAWWVVLPLVRWRSNAASRTSVAAALNQEDDMAFVRPLVERVVAASQDHPWQCWEAPVVTKYEPGAIFALHADASPTKGSEWKDVGGQRVVTCICYLNTVCTGGETFFDKLDLAVKPVAGKALFFFPADRETWKADDRTTHESLPPTSEKWIVQMFGRAQPVPSPLGLPNLFKSVS